MNCISGSIVLTCLFACVACGAPASETEADVTSLNYAVHYSVSPNRRDGSVDVEMSVTQTRGQLRELSFAIAGSQVSNFEADGVLEIDRNNVTWRPERKGGSLRWRAAIPHRRGNGGYDALLDENWGLFRAEDIIPRGRTRTLRGAYSETTMTFELPGTWTAVSEYSTLDSHIEVSIPGRRFDQPRGWMVMGDLGIRRETIAGTRVAVVAPEGQAVRRMDMLALLNWTLPELNMVLPDSLPRLTIVSAGDPMWRGGLSAPASIFIHAERPLISENATSTLVHEIVHVATNITAENGYDWIVEGIAEFYSLEILQRGGAITVRRYSRALEKQEDWAKDAEDLCTIRSSGATTALAVVTFRNLDIEIKRKSEGEFSLDHLVAKLADLEVPVTLDLLNAAAEDILLEPSDTLHIENLPGCQSIAQSQEA